jgi:hypothetical protein
VTEGNATDAARFFFPSHTNEERMESCCLGRVKNADGARARRNHFAIGEPDPLVAVLGEELVTSRPVGGFVFAPVQVPGGSWSAIVFIGKLGFPLRPVFILRSMHRRVDLALLGQPRHVAPVGVLLDFTKELDALRFVTGFARIIGGMTISTSTATTKFSL